MPRRQAPSHRIRASEKPITRAAGAPPQLPSRQRHHATTPLPSSSRHHRKRRTMLTRTQTFKQHGHFRIRHTPRGYTTAPCSSYLAARPRRRTHRKCYSYSNLTCNLTNARQRARAALPEPRHCGRCLPPRDSECTRTVTEILTGCQQLYAERTHSRGIPGMRARATTTTKADCVRGAG